MRPPWYSTGGLDGLACLLGVPFHSLRSTNGDVLCRHDAAGFAVQIIAVGVLNQDGPVFWPCGPCCQEAAKQLPTEQVMMRVEQILTNANFQRHRWHGSVGEHSRIKLMELCVHGWIKAGGTRVGLGHSGFLCNATSGAMCIASSRRRLGLGLKIF